MCIVENNIYTYEDIMQMLQINYQIEWEIVRTYDMRNITDNGTERFSREEIIYARNIIINELEQEHIEQYKPDLILMDSAQRRTDKIMVVHAMISNEANEYDGNESRNRTFYIEDGKIIKIKKGQSKK